MGEFPSSVRSVRFGVFEVDLRAGELKKKGIRIRLQGQPFLLLITLLKQQGEVVAREELRRTLWPEDTFVDFDHSLGTAINKLREVLGDSAANPRFVETLPRRGYRFIAPVVAVGEREDMPIPSEALPYKQEPATGDPLETRDHDQIALLKGTAVGVRRRWPLPWKISGLAILMLTAGVMVLILLRSRPPTLIRSLAVLPLENLSGDPSQEYFSDGMTDELITELGQIRELRVISRTSVMTYKGTKKTLPTIAQELGADAVVEGSILHEGNEIRVTAQLIDARTDRHLWARSYVRDLTSVLSLQGEVAQAIANEVSANVTPQEEARLTRPRPVGKEAQDLYLIGLHFYISSDPRSAIVYFQQSVDKDPNYAPSHAGLASSYGWLGEAGWLPYDQAFPRQKAEALKAIAIDEALPEGHLALATAVMNLNWDWAACEREIKRTLDLNPSSAATHAAYGLYLMRVGRSDEAREELKQTQLLDPVSSNVSVDQGFASYFARHYDDALNQFQRAGAIEPNPAVFSFPLGVIYVEKKMYPEAIAEFQKLGDQPHALGHMGNAYARMGRTEDARVMISRLEEHVRKDGVGRFEIALVYAGLNEKDQAFAWLEKSYAAHDKGLTYLRIDPCLDPLRADPRFQDLIHRVGFPA